MAIYLHPWERVDAANSPVDKRSAVIPGALGNIDLRTNAQKRDWLNMPGYALAEFNTPPTNPNAILLGDRLSLPLSGIEATLRGELSIGERIPGSTLLDGIWHIMTNLADPTGDSHVAPLRGRVLEMYLGGHTPIAQKRVTALDSEWANVRHRMRNTWLKVSALTEIGIYSPGYDRRYLSVLMKTYRTQDYEQFQSGFTLTDYQRILNKYGVDLSGRQFKTPLPAQTSFDYTFNASNQEGWPALGGISGTEVQGDIKIVGNRGASSIVLSTTVEARLESSLGSDNHSANFDVHVLPVPSTTNKAIVVGPMVRYNPTGTGVAATDGYNSRVQNNQNGTQQVTLNLDIDDAFVASATPVAVTIALPDNIKVQSDGDTHKAWYENVLKITWTNTDTTNDGNDKAGVSSFNRDAHWEIDTYHAETVVATTRRIFVVS